MSCFIDKYYIPKHRYYELKHFCLQYPTWRNAYYSLDGLAKKSLDINAKDRGSFDPTGKSASGRLFYQQRMDMVEKAASKTRCSDYILNTVAYGLSYNYLSLNTDISISREDYYEEYRKFFWVLNKIRE